LLLIIAFEFCDCQDAANLGCREFHFVTGVQIFGRDAVF